MLSRTCLGFKHLKPQMSQATYETNLNIEPAKCHKMETLKETNVTATNVTTTNARTTNVINETVLK